MHILSIGNSFSQDATRYASNIAACDGYDFITANLYIGGCPLFKHFQNISNDAKEYFLEYNGVPTNFKVSIKEALLNREWNVITLQQVSTYSKNYATYQPYLDELYNYCRKYAPKAKIYIHQTWAYEEGSHRLVEEQKYAHHVDMFNDVKKAYAQAAEAINAAGIIPAGELINAMCAKGFKMHRDTFHLSMGIGRYAVGLLWYAYLTGKDITDNSFNKFDVEVTDEEIAAAKMTVKEILAK